MKNIKYVMLMLICLLLVGCTTTVPNTPPTDGETSSTEQNTPPSSTVLPEKEYNEEADSLEGVDVTDLSLLKNAFDSVNSNYAADTYVFFNELAIERVNIIYNTYFYCKLTTLYNSNYLYQFSDDFVIDNAYLNYNNGIYTTGLKGNTLPEKLNSTIDLESLELIYSDTNVVDKFFTLDELNSNYVDTYGPFTKEFSSSYTKEYEGWTRISENKFKCDREEVLVDFMHICAPGFSNDGTYMTFRYVTVEVNPDDTNVMRLRLYASPTQIGKLLPSHKNAENTNWYLLFAEAYIYNVDQIAPSVLESLYQ